jgi:adenosylhomocysteinase
MAGEKRRVREFIEQYLLPDGRRINLLAEGRLVNLAAAEGHPASVMDMSFANQALALEYMLQHASELENKVYGVPEDIDREIARLKLEAMGITSDAQRQQRKYLASWKAGLSRPSPPAVGSWRARPPAQDPMTSLG